MTPIIFLPGMMCDARLFAPQIAALSAERSVSVAAIGDLPEGFPVVAGSIGPSHAFVHVREIGTPVEIFGMAVQDGDLIHADRHGALVIPEEVIPMLEDAILKLLETEKLVLEPARQDGFDFEQFEQAWAAFEAART